jgi:hypothetical protein
MQLNPRSLTLPTAALLSLAVSLSSIGVLRLMAAESATTQSPEQLAKPLAHIVFFTLAERTPENREKLVANCKKYLDKHDGLTHFSVGVNAPEYDRPVNDRDYDVAIHLVFATAKDQNAYQTAPRHLEFIKESKSLWAKVRVFDSYIE